jgi:hypothetical protein
VCSTKRQTTIIVGVVALLVIVSIGVAVFLYATPPAQSSSTSGGVVVSSTGAPWFKVNKNALSVGYNSGLWEFQIQDVSGKQVRDLTAVLNTPTESKMCTSVLGGFNFGNCGLPAGGGNPFAANATFTGYTTGAGPGSATPGKSYSVTVTATFVDGSTTTDTVSVKAATSA